MRGPRYGHAVLGGTFDRLHAGHAALLATAFRLGRTVSIGVTTDAFLSAHPKPDGGRIPSYASRRRALRRWLSRRYPVARWKVVPLGDPFGRSVEPGVDVLVVSADTVKGGRAVNVERRRRGRPATALAVVPLVLADDLLPVSSRRIRAGTIDRNGRRRSPLSFGLGLSDEADRDAAFRAIRRVFPTAQISVMLDPFGGRGRGATGARSLARAAAVGRELGLGVARAPRGGWFLVEQGPLGEIGPIALSRGSSAELGARIASLLAPRVGRKAFPPGRPSRR